MFKDESCLDCLICAIDCLIYVIDCLICAIGCTLKQVLEVGVVRAGAGGRNGTERGCAWKREGARRLAGYRGTSLIRNSPPPPRTTIGPSA